MVQLKNTIIEIFKLLIHKVHKENPKGAHFKIRAYNDVCKALIETDVQLTDIKQIETILKEFGMKNPKKTLEKIKEIIETGTLASVEELKTDPQILVLQNLTKIYAIGPKNATKLYNEHGCFTIEQLRTICNKDPSVLNKKQTLGLKYYDDLEKRIPRKEIHAYQNIFYTTVIDVRRELDNNSITFSINGSYRREQSESGDIDVLITGEGDTSMIRKNFIQKLIDNGVLVETLANGKKKFMGISILPNYPTHRHVDIIDTSLQEYPFAQLYFTGSAGFNAKMRNISLHRGFSLNEYRLSYKTTKNAVESVDFISKLGQPYCKTERDIFRFLDIEYVEPKDRKDIILSKY